MFQGVFLVKSAYTAIMEGRGNYVQKDIFRDIWKVKVPPKVNFFVWRLKNSSLPTTENLVKRNVQIQNWDSKCPFCNELEESTEHTMFSSKKSSRIWNYFMQVLDIDFVSPNSACAYFEQHVISSGKSNLSDGWKILWCAIMCNLWNSRNNCIFRDKQFDCEDVIQSILFNCWSWLSAFNALFSVSYIQWMANNSTSLMG